MTHRRWVFAGIGMAAASAVVAWTIALTLFMGPPSQHRVVVASSSFNTRGAHAALASPPNRDEVKQAVSKRQAIITAKKAALFKAYIDGVMRAEFIAAYQRFLYQKSLAEIHRNVQPSVTPVAPSPSVPAPVYSGTAGGSVGGYPCGGDLPSCCTLTHESGGNPTIVNNGGDPRYRASGLWQFMPGTWNNFAGYPYASAAPPSVQNEKARQIVASEGYSPWYGDGCYNGR